MNEDVPLEISDEEKMVIEFERKTLEKKLESIEDKKEEAVTKAEIQSSKISTEIAELDAKQEARQKLFEANIKRAQELATRLYRLDGDKFFDIKTRSIYKKNAIDWVVDPIISDTYGKRHHEAFTMFVKGTPSYRGLDYLPNGGITNKIEFIKNPDGEYINMFSGFPGRRLACAYDGFDYEKPADKPTEIEKFIFWAICSGNSAAAEFLMIFLKHILKKPTDKTAWIPILQGPEGTGKTTFLSILKKVLGDTNVYCAEPADFETKFNSHMANKMVIFADEATFSGNIQQMNKLKMLSGGETMRVEQKGIEAYSVRNFARLFIATNEGWAAPFEENSRRYIFLKTTKDNHGKIDWTKLWSEIESDDGIGCFTARIMKLDETKFDWHSNEPPRFFEMETAEQKLLTMTKIDPIGAWLTDEDVDGCDSIEYIIESEGFIASSRAWDLFQRWWSCNKTSHAREMTKVKLSIDLQKRGYKATMRRIGSMNVRGFVKD
jgi:hypothetical protein